MERKKLRPEEARRLFDSTPERKVGQWAKVLDEIEKSGVAEKISGLSRGSAWGLKRTAKERGFEVRVLEKGTAVLILPKVKAPTQK